MAPPAGTAGEAELGAVPLGRGCTFCAEVDNGNWVIASITGAMANSLRRCRTVLTTRGWDEIGPMLSRVTVWIQAGNQWQCLVPFQWGYFRAWRARKRLPGWELPELEPGC